MYDPETGRVKRGELVLTTNLNFFQLPCTIGSQFRIYPFHFQLLMKILDLVKLIVLACLVAGVGSHDDNNERALLSLLVLSLVMLFVIRLTKPFLNRWDMAVGLFVECMDFLVYACLFSIVDSDQVQHRYSERVCTRVSIDNCLRSFLRLVSSC